MQSVFNGRVANGVVVFDDDARPVDGAVVTVVVKPVEDGAVGYDALLRIAELAVPTGIPDLATNLDHYLYGHPKVSDEGA